MAEAAELIAFYRSYIACLNDQEWSKLSEYVAEDVRHNDRVLGVSSYRTMLEGDFEQIPDLHFDIELLASDPPLIAARLRFDCTPKGAFVGLPVDGKRIRFTENVIYECRDGRIGQVWSVIDKMAIEARLAEARN